jgi:hypothetical protein
LTAGCRLIAGWAIPLFGLNVDMFSNVVGPAGSGMSGDSEGDDDDDGMSGDSEHEGMSGDEGDGVSLVVLAELLCPHAGPHCLHGQRFCCSWGNRVP